MANNKVWEECRNENWVKEKKTKIEIIREKEKLEKYEAEYVENIRKII